MSKQDIVYVIIIEDRHSDVEVEVWSDRGLAIDRARELAKKYCRHEEDYEEQEIDGWEFMAVYSCESDCCRVIKSEVSDE